MHWIEYFDRNDTIEQGLDKVRRLILSRAAPNEITPGKNARFAVVRVATLHDAAPCLEGTTTTFHCCHTPRIAVDSHSSVYPDPGVEAWSVGETEQAYRFAVQAFLAECAEEETYTFYVTPSLRM